MTGQLNLPLRLSDSASFDNFYPIGNEEVVEVVRSVTKRTTDKPSLFIHGPPGSGKSHLLQALSRLTIEAHGLNVYVPCLLYTSPSPRDYAASRMPSSA